MPSAGSEPTLLASGQSQMHTLNRVYIGIV
jgi:hypothetical protein